MGKLFDKIRDAVKNEHYFVSVHADERCEEREVSAWQIVCGLEAADLIRERPASKPNPSVVVTELLVDGTEVEVIWAWLADRRQAVLVTVYFKD